MLARIDKTGRLLIPSQFRKELGFRPGSEVLLRSQDGELRVYTRNRAVRRIQAWAQKLAPPGTSIVDEFLAERKEEARRERRELDKY